MPPPESQRRAARGSSGPWRSQVGGQFCPGQGLTLLLCPPPQLITVYSLPGMDPDWLIGERGNKKGKVPVTYLELLS